MSSGRKRQFESQDPSNEPPLKHFYNEDFNPESCFSFTKQDSPNTTEGSYTVSYRTSWSSGKHLTVIDSNGCRKMLRVKSNEEMENEKETVTSVSGSGQLLFVPFHKLRETVEQRRYKRLMEESDETASQQLNTSVKQTITRVNESEKSVLWSEKYSPKQFTDLLSDDGINRTVLSWLKLWDETVFGNTSLLKNPPNKKSDSNSAKKGWRNPNTKRFKATQWEVQDPQHFGTEQALDETRRPKQKVVLLCGPPGLGKTTLVHIAAQHSGYNVVEMNASDDRSPEVFKKVLESSTEMKAVLTANSKPNCLVIDEIDGAPVTAINVLIDVIKARNKSTKKSKKSKTILSRPIICICNDLYTASLRTLRQYATVIPIPQTLTSRLASRLLEICKQECMNASMPVLMALCEKTDNDIRTCLNTLQFINQKHGDLSIGSIQNSSIGKKDIQKNHIAFMKDVFKLPPAKKALIDPSTGVYQGIKASSNTLQSQRLLDILSSAYSTGEYDKVLQGVYENYLEVKVRDPNLEIIAGIQDWIIFNELLNTEVMTSREYVLMPYLPFLSVAFHFSFATSSGHRTKFPTSDYEAYQLHQRNQQIIVSLVSDTTPSVRRNISNISSVNFIPYLLNIITPSFRPVNPQLYTKWEKQVLLSVIQTMISYNLTYHQEQTTEGQYIYAMDPNIEQLSNYSCLSQKKQLPYIIKQMLAREIELEKVKSESKSTESVSHTKDVSSHVNSKRRTNKDFTKLSAEANELRHKRDFFGRAIISNKVDDSKDGSKDKQQQQQQSSVLSSSLWFKFNKGFSDAVKRPIRIKDLL